MITLTDSVIIFLLLILFSRQSLMEKRLKKLEQPENQRPVLLKLFTIQNGTEVKVSKMKVTQKLPLFVKAFDAKGNEVAVLSPVFSLSDSSLGSFDGMMFIPAGPVGSVSIKAEALGLSDSMDLVLEAGDPVSLKLSAGEPVDA